MGDDDTNATPEPEPETNDNAKEFAAQDQAPQPKIARKEGM